MTEDTANLMQRIQALEGERSQLREIINNIPDFIYFKDRQCHFLNGNKSLYESLHAKSIEEIVGKSDLDFFSPTEAARFIAVEKKVMDTGIPTTIEEQGIKENGQPRYLQTTKTPIRDPQTNEVVGLVGITRDVSEINTARKELAEKSAALEKRSGEIEYQRKQLQTLIDHIPDFIYFKDRQSRFLNGNNKFYQGLNAATMKELVGKSDLDFFAKEQAEAYMKDEQEMMETNIPVSKTESGTDKNGQPFYLQTTKTPIHDPETNKINGFVGISRDVTEITKARDNLVKQANDLRKQKEEVTQTLSQLKQAQTKLVQSEKMASLGVLTAGIAHEINNPINFVYAGVNSIVKDFADVKQIVVAMKKLQGAEDPKKAIQELEELQEEYEFDEAFEALEETLSDVKLGATRITEIVAGLSKFSRMGKESWQISNIHDDLDSVLILLKNKYKTHIKIHKSYAENLPSIECFPSKLNQAFMNLVSNAIDAINDKTSKGGTILISTQYSEKTVTVSVKDDGIGMNDETRSKILDPFFTTKDTGKGVGLGLAITNSIIEDHRATLTIDTQENQGSNFQITLPIQQAAK